MARIIAIDYGTKRIGIAVTDELKIIATALTAVKTADTITFLENYFKQHQVEAIVVGKPLRLDGSDTDATKHADKFVSLLKKKFPEIPIYRADERFTSKIAQQTMVTMGLKKKDRAKKENIDMLSAVLILQTYLESIK